MYKFCLLFLWSVSFANADVSSFRFHPIKNSSCYQVYTKADTVNALTCRRPHKEGKRSCVTGLKDNDDYCEITTPSGESVRVPCPPPRYGYPLLDTNDAEYHFSRTTGPPDCFKTYKDGLNITEICPKMIDEKSIGVVTPDGYTILLFSESCKVVKSKEEINADIEFTSSFTFDPEERSCYKIYTPDQPISSYTCYEDHIIYSRIHRSCVETWDKNENCSVVTTQNNETIILDCEGETSNKANCLKVHKDGNITEACMEILEEGCMGITTPSGLRMLFACRVCGVEKYYPLRYDKEKLKLQRKFIKTYWRKEKKNLNSYYRSYFKIIINEYTKKTFYAFWLANSNCYGFTINNNETVMFNCTDREFKPGCFKVRNSQEMNETDICAFVYEEKCVIVETPKGIRITLACYDEEDGKAKVFIRNELKNFKNGNYSFYNTTDVVKKLYKTGIDCKKQIEDYQTQWLHEHQCWGTVTPEQETILLDCPNDGNKNKRGCFQVYAQNYTSDNQILPFSYETYETCIEIINDLCVGVVTRKGWNVQLSCFLYSDDRCCDSKPVDAEME